MVWCRVRVVRLVGGALIWASQVQAGVVDTGLPTLEASELEYRAPRGCPSAEQFLHEVNARAQYSRPFRVDTALRHVGVRVERSRNATLGTMEIPLRDGGTARREVQAASCEEVVAALALVTAVALDAEAVLLGAPESLPAIADGSGRSQSEPLPTLSEGVTDPSEREDARAALAAESEPDRREGLTAQPTEGWIPMADKDVDPVTAVFGPRTPRGFWAAGFHMDAIGGVFPGVAFAPRLFVDARLERSGVFTPAARLSAARAIYEVPHDNGSGSAELSWTAGRADLCPVSFDFSDTGAFWPCPTFEAGIMRASDDPDLWILAGMVSRAQWILLSVLLIEVEAGVALPFVRPDAARYETSATNDVAIAYGSVGFGGRFP